MLLLNREQGEVIRIGDEISMVICEIRGGQVRVGIVAPREIEVHREEVYIKIQKDKKTNGTN